MAVETIGNWYWIVDEIEAAGCVPKLVHARKAKLMMGELNCTAPGSLDTRESRECPVSGNTEIAAPLVERVPGGATTLGVGADQPTPHAAALQPSARAWAGVR